MIINDCILKKVIAFALLFTINAMTFCCSDRGSSKNVLPNKLDTLYEVYKIDSTNNHYLIYATLDSTKYKIVSRVIETSSGETIKKGGHYYFKLLSLLLDYPIIPGPRECIRLDKSTIICTEDSIPNIYLALKVEVRDGQKGD